MLTVLKRFVRDENAAEVTELGIVLALVVAGCVLAIGAIGVSVQNAYTLVDTNLP